jgi:RNA polymerase sigma-70 factor, ECF subfamily
MMHATMTPVAREPEADAASDTTVAAGRTFADLVTRYQFELYGFALGLTRNRADADDLYQETLLRAFRAYDRLDGAANHRAWLYRIATNVFLSGRRRAGREGPLDEAAEVAIPEDQPDHASRLDARDLLREVAAFVDTLPEKQRVALVLRKYQGLGYDEIAAALQSSEAAARFNVHSALRKLRDRFADRLDDGDPRLAGPPFNDELRPAN